MIDGESSDAEPNGNTCGKVEDKHEDVLQCWFVLRSAVRGRTTYVDIIVHGPDPGDHHE